MGSTYLPIPADATFKTLESTFEGRDKVLDVFFDLVDGLGESDTHHNYFSVINNDAAFEFTEWEPLTSAGQVFDNADETLVKYKFTQKPTNTLAKIECDSDSFAVLENPITITDSTYNYVTKQDPANPGWNYTPKNTQIIIFGDKDELVGRYRIQAISGGTRTNYEFDVNGTARIPDVSADVKLHLDKPTYSILKVSTLPSGFTVLADGQSITTDKPIAEGAKIIVTIPKGKKCTIGYKNSNFKNYDTTTEARTYKFDMPGVETSFKVENYVPMMFLNSHDDKSLTDIYFNPSGTLLQKDGEGEFVEYDVITDVLPLKYIDSAQAVSGGNLKIGFTETGNDGSDEPHNWIFMAKNNDAAYNFIE